MAAGPRGAVALATLPILSTGGTISRWEGAVFLGYYAAHTLYLVLGATQHAVLTSFRSAMLWLVLPLTVLTLGSTGARALRSGEGRGEEESEEVPPGRADL